MKVIKVIIFLGIIIGLLSYIFISSQNNKEKLVELKRKDMKYINTNSIKDIIKSNRFVIFYYSEFDCESCIALGYEVMNKLLESNKKNGISFFIIENSEKIVSDSILYNNNVSIIKDDKNLMKKALLYIDTPMLVFKNNANSDSGIVVKIKNDLFTEQSIKNVSELNKLIY